jgi:UrcA family protein
MSMHGTRRSRLFHGHCAAAFTRPQQTVISAQSTLELEKMMKTFAIAVATLVTGCLAATAQATVPVKSGQQQVVRYGDLNLASESDSAILLGRIKSAARNVCGLHQGVPMPIEIQARLQACAQDATARALAEVDAAASVNRRGEIVVLNAFE